MSPCVINSSFAALAFVMLFGATTYASTAVECGPTAPTPVTVATGNYMGIDVKVERVNGELISTATAAADSMEKLPIPKELQNACFSALIRIELQQNGLSYLETNGFSELPTGCNALINSSREGEAMIRYSLIQPKTGELFSAQSKVWYESTSGRVIAPQLTFVRTATCSVMSPVVIDHKGRPVSGFRFSGTKFTQYLGMTCL